MSRTTLTDIPLLPSLPHGRVHFLHRYSPERRPASKPNEAPTTGDGRLRVRCPHCQWQPKQRDRWSCTCGHIWNTFDTGGVCPECDKIWQQTQCLQCQLWSRHDDWYVWEKSQEKK